MPEVSEVAITVEILSNNLKNKTLKSFNFVSGRFHKVHPPNYNLFCNDLPLKLVTVESVGKFIWFEFKGAKKTWFLFNTLGLSGLWSFNKENDVKASLDFSENKQLFFYDVRNFGTFKFTTDKKELESKINSLKPDFLKDDFDLSNITKYKTPIVKLLMDQKKLGSGIGNYLSAEILYMAKLSPFRTGASLSKFDVENLIYAIKFMTKLSYINNKIGYMTIFKNIYIPQINYHPEIELGGAQFKFNVYRQKKDPNGYLVEASKIIKGRTTYWVPSVQK